MTRRAGGDERDWRLQFFSPEQYRERYGRDPEPREPTATSSDVRALIWDPEAGAGYFALTAIEPGDAVTQEFVTNPVPGIGPVVLDFDAWGRLLGIEFLDKRALPPGLSPS